MAATYYPSHSTNQCASWRSASLARKKESSQ